MKSTYFWDNFASKSKLTITWVQFKKREEKLLIVRDIPALKKALSQIQKSLHPKENQETISRILKNLLQLKQILNMSDLALKIGIELKRTWRRLKSPSNFWTNKRISSTRKMKL